MIPGISANPFQGRPINPRHLFRARQDGWILDPADHSTLWIDEARTQNATLPGDVVWWIDDKSPNQNHFGAVSSAARGRLYRWPASAVLEGCPRNLLLDTDNLSGSSWTNVGYTWSDGVARPPAGLLTGTETLRQIPVPLLATGQRYAFSVRAKAAGYDNITLSIGATRLCAWYNLQAGVSTNSRVDNVEWANISTDMYVDPDDSSYFICVVSGDKLGTEGAASTIRVLVNQTATYSGAAQGEIYTADGVSGAYVEDVQVNVGSTRLNYQRVGSGIWDVTEEGQPDCWGILGDGISTLYTSAAGVVFPDNIHRSIVGQTKLNPAPTATQMILTNQFASSNTGCRSYINSADYSYRSLLRINGVNATMGGATHAAPHSAALDQSVDGNTHTISLRVNNDTAISASASESGGVGGSNWHLFGNGSGSTLYSGVIWGAILVAGQPSPGKWEQAARQWLSGKMGGILDV